MWNENYKSTLLQVKVIKQVTRYKQQNRKLVELEICQYDTDGPDEGPSSPAHGHFANKNEVEKGP